MCVCTWSCVKNSTAKRGLLVKILSSCAMRAFAEKPWILLWAHQVMKREKPGTSVSTVQLPSSLWVSLPFASAWRLASLSVKIYANTGGA